MTRKATLVFVFVLLLVSCAAPHAPEATPSSASTAAEASSGSELPRETTSPPDTRESDSGEAGSEPTESSTPSEGTPKKDPEADPKDDKKNRAPGRIVLDTVYDDQRVGKDQIQLIEAELGLVQDKALNDYVRSVAIRLLRHAPSRPFDYEFKIVDQSVPNAFALPGGKIFVSRGLLALATSEDELAGVLGHEITHSAERHASAQIEYNRRMNPLAIGLLRAARIAAYGRDQERDADRGGQILAARAGYDPEGIATFLRKLDSSERYEIGWSRLPSFLATHPTSPERSALATNRATTLEWKRVPSVAGDGSGGPDAYYTMIDGLIIGDDPAGGLFDEENRFIHPELRFSIRFPQGWTTMNSQQAVRALSPALDAQATLAAMGAGDVELSKIVDDFIDSDFEGMTIRVQDRHEIKIGELPAIRIEGRAASLLGSLAIQMTFVRYGDLVYRLTVLSISDSGSRFRGRARAFAHSFRPLDDAGVRTLKVTRLRVARALEDETLQALSSRTRNVLELGFTGVLNGIFASSPLAYRTPVKIGIEEPYLPKPKPVDPKASEAENTNVEASQPEDASEGGGAPTSELPAEPPGQLSPQRHDPFRNPL